MSQRGGSEVAIRIERTLHAPPDRVFRAFLDPDLMRQWVTPDDLDLERITVDPRVGGRIEVWHARNGLSTGKFEGRFVKIDPPRELVYHWAFVGTEPEKGEYYDTLVRVMLVPWAEGQTKITVVHERLEELRRGAPHVYPRLVPGWENCLDKLERAARSTPANRP
ncbi:MAG: SRPBCC domain-containing protein [Euryarchaeota archaeon]|nr:SRPBCC domain-containing protein [Euryarchaeota archaeon]MDE1837503.1 SRPBCC domain-containing protein [Euryarchaeota archaeon]MDE1880541.1 SRPBCC domain-containing protein [Euryarchaeota archaeon]MDE2045531.1 SRPBCC domain-containing protein [Thermoplasmata archaeon]